MWIRGTVDGNTSLDVQYQYSTFIKEELTASMLQRINLEDFFIIRFFFSHFEDPKFIKKI